MKMSKASWIGLVLLIADLATLYALELWWFAETRGCYHLWEILFM